MAEDAKQPKHRTRRVIGAWSVGVLVASIALLGLLATPVGNQVFPERTIAECTAGNPAEIRSLGGRRAYSVPLANTDCGAFRISQDTACTSDPARTIQLASGLNYDLVVRGPRVPFLVSPWLVSAQVSAEQPAPSSGTGRLSDLEAMRSRLDDTLAEIDPEGEAARAAERAESEAAIAELAAEFSAETLRAFDYEQPPYDERCDSWRTVMTSQGLQHMTRADAAEKLALPAGVTPHDPLLPCEGFQCANSGE
ncbi:hypothetical protein [Leucobacter luti]|uniref:hypothetical protein n=1 Tax=Leucobacter luti TaxID=340320 RepID=UPI001C6878C8|nr:hypothetical protein [Leucobacter luti]QYM75656.1 hypothetical protein K1X41_13730 [Leucobacter luti]